MENLISVNKLYNRDHKLKDEDVKSILEWAEKQPHLPKVSELQAALALHSCFYRIEAAKNSIENYFTIRTACPDIYGNTNLETNQQLKMVVNTLCISLLPEKSPEGYQIAFTKLIDLNPDHYNPTMGNKIFDMLHLLSIHTQGPSNGVVTVTDLAGTVFGHMTKVNLTQFRTGMLYLQTAMPIRLMAVHFINVVPFMDKIMALIKPFVSKELYEKVHIHTNNETLYKYIPKDRLPSDYGGNCDSVSVLHEKTKKLIEENQWFFDYQDSLVVDETKRIGTRKNTENLFGTDGTFKKLEVD